jgi:HSP20 family protein
MRRWFRDFDRWSEPRGWPFAALRTGLPDFPWTPEVEMTERDHQLMIKVDLPGLKKEEVNVSVTDEGLVIEGERTRETESKNDESFTTERTYGRFYRMVPLPEGMNHKEVKATLKNGVLEITAPIPTAATTAPYRVPVEGEPEASKVKVAT